MADIKICDRCGEKIVAKCHSTMEYQNAGSTILPNAKLNTYDLCKDCKKAFGDFMAKKPMVVNARWIKTFVTMPYPMLPETRAVCSNCTHIYSSQAFNFKHCPECGAIMED